MDCKLGWSILSHRKFCWALVCFCFQVVRKHVTKRKKGWLSPGVVSRTLSGACRDCTKRFGSACLGGHPSGSALQDRPALSICVAFTRLPCVSVAATTAPSCCGDMSAHGLWGSANGIAQESECSPLLTLAECTHWSPLAPCPSKQQQQKPSPSTDPVSLTGFVQHVKLRYGSRNIVSVHQLCTNKSF